MDHAHPPGADIQTRWLAYGELVRLSNVPTVVADVAAGYLLARSAVEPGRWEAGDVARLAMLVVASGALYMAGMVLNDVFDYEVDRRERPERPLPSGRVSREAAAWLGGALLLLGLAGGWFLAAWIGRWRPGLTAVALAACIVAYDGLLKRTPVGPVAMGACRSLNLLLASSAVGRGWAGPEWLVAAAVGIYIAGVTGLARREAERSRPVALVGALGVMVCGISALAALPLWSDRIIALVAREPAPWYALLAMVGAVVVARGATAVRDPRPPVVQRAVAGSIRTLVVLDAAIVLAVGGVAAAVAVLALLVPMTLAGRVFRAT